MKSYLILFLSREKLLFQADVPVPAEANEAAAMVIASRMMPADIDKASICEIKWFPKDAK